MEIISYSRESCRIATLVYIAYTTGEPVIVYTKLQKLYVIEVAKKMNIFDLIKVYTIDEWQKHKEKEKERMNKVLSELPDCFNKEEIRKLTEMWTGLGKNLSQEEITEIIKQSELR